MSTPGTGPGSGTNTPTINPNNPAYKLLSRAHSTPKASSIFIDKIRTKPLLLHPSHSGSNSRSLRRHIRQHKRQYYIQHSRPRPLSAKEKRSLNLLKLSPHEIKYDIYRDLNRLWTGYILEVLGFSAASLFSGASTAKTKPQTKIISSESHGSLLCSADFHGMQVEVVQCVDVGRVGLKGIIVRETRSTFVIVLSCDRVVTVLKKGAVFRVVVDLPGEHHPPPFTSQIGIDIDMDTGMDRDTGDLDGVGAGRRIVFDLHGSELEIRPVERASRKFKWHAICPV